MTEADVIHLLRRHHEGYFPKVCNNCGRRYATLRDYILKTQRLWPTTSYDAAFGRFDVGLAEQLGGMAMANCICGSTLALSTKNMPNAQMRQLLAWGQAEMKQRGWSQQQLLDHVRDEIRRQVLAEPDPAETRE
jgi:hypothetical protein